MLGIPDNYRSRPSPRIGGPSPAGGSSGIERATVLESMSIGVLVDLRAGFIRPLFLVAHYV